VSSEDLKKGIEVLRTVQLHRAIRGVDAEQARKLLDYAANLLVAAAREQNELHRELERLRKANDEDAIGKALVAATRTAEEIVAEAREQAASATRAGEEIIAEARERAASSTRSGEEIVAEARERAASIIAEAEGRAAALLDEVTAQAERREQETAAAREQFDRELEEARSARAKELESARVEADAALADARDELARIEERAARMRSVVTDTERRVVDIVQAALTELEGLEIPSGSEHEGDLLSDLQPGVAPNEISIDEPQPTPPAQ
jgi:cell division septum initiation protein DivIVA